MNNRIWYYFSTLIIGGMFYLKSSVAYAYLPVIRPSTIHMGDTVALIASASPLEDPILIERAKQRLEDLGLNVKYGKNLYKRYGYLAGTVKERAEDVNAMFADPEVKAIFEIRGGWGSAQILPYLDYDLIKRNPKIIIGYSDITSLLLAINTKTGLVTFHGPMPSLTLPKVSADYLKNMLFSNKIQILQNTSSGDTEDDLIQTQNDIRIINKGTAQGRLIGGNLTLLTGLLGTPYQPDFKGAILFVEDVGEQVYRIDRMLSQLKNAGILNEIAGFIFGECNDCSTNYGKAYGSLTLHEVLDNYIKPLDIPAWSGAMFGHRDDMYTLPEGAIGKIEAEQGTITIMQATEAPSYKNE